MAHALPLFRTIWREAAAAINQLGVDTAMLREFRDKSGVDWLVWDVYPDRQVGEPRPSNPGAFPHRELADGWLCFESVSEKRRVAPIPVGWELWGPEELEDLCANAGYISRPSPRDGTDIGGAREPAPRSQETL